MMTDNPLPIDVIERLIADGIQTDDEVELRRLLEAHVSAYTLYRLPPAAARKWKARYRIMLGATYLDCQSAVEAYARAYLFTRETQKRSDVSAEPEAPDSQNS